MNFDYIKSFWGTSLCRISFEVLKDFNLPYQTKHFLEEIGLPQDTSILEGVLEVNFYFDAKKIIKRNHKGTDYCIIGDDLGSTFCISFNDGAVYSIDFNNESFDPFCFVNSSIWQFVHCIQVFSEFQKISKAGKSDEKKIVESMVFKFNDIDPQCLNSNLTWWSIVINQPY